MNLCFARLVVWFLFLFVLVLLLLASFPTLANRLLVIGRDWPVQAAQARVASSDLRGRPTVSAAFIDQVLTFYHSPAVGSGQVLSDLGVQYGIDPVYALAFFLHESSLGTAGVARVSFSPGNLRCIPTVACQGGYAYFPSWAAGWQAWYRLIAGPAYFGSGLYTVEQIIPKYAPASDGNNEAAYIASVEHAVATWRAGHVEVS